ncbi:MAG: Ig-like domain-containing protein [Solirubrobacteraceae bacterium]
MSRLWLALAALLAIPGVTASGADFTAASTSPANAFGAAADFNTVAVAMSDPGAPLHGTVSLDATASSERGIDAVRFETSVPGAGVWVEACEDGTAPYACDWDTAGVADGSRDLRAVAVDQAGYERASAALTRLVDNGAPTVSLDAPDPWLEGTEVLTTTGADPHSGLATLAIDYRPAGRGAWTEVCSGPISPRSCPLATTTLADGPYELRARAADAAGNSQATSPVTRTVDNTAPAVAMTDPGTMAGTVALGATTGDGDGTGVASVRYEYREGAGAWTEICTGSTGCAWDTTARADGLYDLRAVATDGAGHATSSAVLTGRIDNTVPSVPTLADPGSPVGGAVALSGTASDSGSGIAAWTAQYRPAGGSTWTDACTGAASPYGCSWASIGVADGLYDLRAVARDAAGNERASAVVTNRRVDNTGPTVALGDPGPAIRATATLTATASDLSGMQSVVFERRPVDGGTWTAICTDSTSAYSCAFDTTVVVDGDYELRARALDTLGNQSTATRTTRVDNTAPAPVDVQAGNGGATPGRLEAGDWVTLTWTEPIAPASVLAGWDSLAQAITVKVQNTGANDRIDFYDAAGQARLNLTANSAGLMLGRNFVTTDGEFDATMLQTGASITITLGARRWGTVATATAGTLAWTPSAAATDLAGNPTSAAQITESGGTDVDF